MKPHRRRSNLSIVAEAILMSILLWTAMLLTGFLLGDMLLEIFYRP